MSWWGHGSSGYLQNVVAIPSSIDNQPKHFHAGETQPVALQGHYDDVASGVPGPNLVGCLFDKWWFSVVVPTTATELKTLYNISYSIPTAMY